MVDDTNFSLNMATYNVSRHRTAFFLHISDISKPSLLWTFTGTAKHKTVVSTHNQDVRQHQQHHTHTPKQHFTHTRAHDIHKRK